MKKKKLCVSETLNRVYSVLARDSSHIYFKGFYISEVVVLGVKIGLGINFNRTLIVIYIIKNDVIYESTDPKKYKPTFKIGIPERAGGKQYWCVELEENRITGRLDELQAISLYLEAATHILKMTNVLSLPFVEILEKPLFLKPIETLENVQ